MGTLSKENWCVGTVGTEFSEITGLFDSNLQFLWKNVHLLLTSFGQTACKIYIICASGGYLYQCSRFSYRETKFMDQLDF